MKHSRSSRQGIVRVSYDDFARFLRQYSELWKVQSSYLERELFRSPASVDELMEAIVKYGDDTESVYVFDAYSESGDPFEGNDYSSWEAIPQVGPEELSACVIRSPRASDFLWFDCSLDLASNEEPAILIMCSDD